MEFAKGIQVGGMQFPVPKASIVSTYLSLSGCARVLEGFIRKDSSGGASEVVTEALGTAFTSEDLTAMIDKVLESPEQYDCILQPEKLEVAVKELKEAPPEDNGQRLRRIKQLIVQHFCDPLGQIWALQNPTEHGAPTPTFPEDALVEDGEAMNARTAVCFSGGGVRAYLCTIGEQNALAQLGLYHLGAIGRVSSVSGGSWGASVGMFASESKFPTDLSLFSPTGAISAIPLNLATLDLSTLTLAHLKVLTEHTPVLKSASKAYVESRGLGTLFDGDDVRPDKSQTDGDGSSSEGWAKTIADAFFKNAKVGGGGKAEFAQRGAHADLVVKRLAKHAKYAGFTEKEIKEQIAITRSKRPFWLCNSAFLGPADVEKDSWLFDCCTRASRGPPDLPHVFTTRYSGVLFAPRGL